MKILVAGDTHGDAHWWSRLVKYATKHHCKTLVQLGDFGYWEHTEDGRAFLRSVSRQCVAAGIVAYFIDGNHENHPLLWEQYPANADGFCEVRPNLFYIPRGHTWEWDGVRFMGLGGAYSIDKGWRLNSEEKRHAPRTLWWPTETITAFDAHQAKQAGPIDVMFSHDCPWGIHLPGIKGEFETSNENRRLLLEVVKATLPRLLVHGHYHMRVSRQLDFVAGEADDGLNWHRTYIEGLDCDGAWNRDAWITFDTSQMLTQELAA